jgi:NAD kinase
MFNPRIAIVTKAPVSKSLAFLPMVSKETEFFNSMSKENYRIGQQFQSIAKRFFTKVDLFQLDQVFHEYNNKVKIFNEYDMIVPIGGDGTFLSCSHFIPNNKKLMFGINSKPSSSVGFLLELKYGPSFEESSTKAMEKIQTGDYEVLHRKRFEVFFTSPKETVKNKIIDENNYLIGLNDLFYGSLSQASTASYLFSIGDEEPQTIRSTGCLIYTGSGSSAWAYSMNQVSEPVLLSILESLNILPNHQTINEIQSFLQKKYQFGPGLNKLAFKHREILTVKKDIPENGTGISFRLQNKTVGAFVAVDGFEHNLEIDEKVDVKLSSPDKDLLCIRFNH